MNWLIGLGSRLHVVGEIVALVLMVKSCEQPAETGAGGSTTTATTTDGGAGGDTGGMAGSGGATGGSGGETMPGGTGGATVTGGGSGGSGGTTMCVPSFACGPKDCGMVDDGCGTMLDCDKPSGIGDAVTCATEGGGETGPMTCGADHVCHCDAEGNSPAAMEKCEGAMAEPAVDAWCAAQGGCDTALCGDPSAPKTPSACIFSGQAIKPNPQDPATWILIWCCSSAP